MQSHDVDIAPDAQPAPRFITSDHFVRMLRVLRAASPELIALDLIVAFEVQSPAAFSIAIVGGAVYIVGSAAHFASLSEENKNNLFRKAFMAVDNFLHANWMTLRLASSIAVSGIVLASKKIGTITVPDWVIIPLEIPAVAVGLGYAITQAKEMRNKPAAILGSVLLAAQLNRLLNMPTDLLDTIGIDVTYIYRTATIILSSGTAVVLKLLENNRPHIVNTQRVLQYASWLTYPASEIFNNIQLKSLVWPVPVYVAQGIAAAGTLTAFALIARQYRRENQPEEQRPLISIQTEDQVSKKACRSCWSGVSRKLGNCWARLWSRSASTDNLSSASAQMDLSAETDQNSKSPSSDFRVQ